MKSIIRLLPKLVDAAGDNSELLETAAKIAWSRAAGHGLRSHTTPLRLYDHKLSVAVADAIWRTQLKAMSAELLARINQLLGREVIKSLEFRIDPTSLQTRGERTARTNLPSILVPPDVLNAAGEIQDEILRERFLSAAKSVIARRESRTLP